MQIVVKDGFSPQAGVRVLFQPSDTNAIEEVATDATGLAKAEMPTGGTLTVIRTYPTAIPPEVQRLPTVYSYLGVEAGDRLELGNSTSEASPQAINVMVPASSQGTVTVMTPCGSGQGTAPLIAITVRDCPADVDFYVTTQDGSAFFKRAPYSSNVDLSAEILKGTLGTSLSARNVPTDTAVSVEERMVSGTYEIFSSGQKRVDTTPADVNLPDLQNVDQLVVATISTNNRGTQIVSRRSPYDNSPVFVDASVGMIPFVNTVTYSPTGVSWLEDGSGAADLVIATLDVTPQGLGSPVTEYVRAIIAPHGGTSLPLPLLQGADAIYNPSAADQIVGRHAIANAGGYAAARVHAFSLPTITDGAPEGGMVTLSFAGNTPPSL